ncbi:hypothetical protein LL963_00130 [Xanthomonas campestris pv. esculenti]|nr:hypothetical protein [Xanthomonas campestris pv. esculenti]
MSAVFYWGRQWWLAPRRDVVCAALFRFARLHGALKALANLAITTAVVCAVVMQDGSAPPWQNALLIAACFSVPASLCVVLVSAATAWVINKRRARH